MVDIIVPSLFRLALTMVRELPLAEKFQVAGVATSLVCYGTLPDRPIYNRANGY